MHLRQQLLRCVQHSGSIPPGMRRRLRDRRSLLSRKLLLFGITGPVVLQAQPVMRKDLHDEVPDEGHVRSGPSVPMG